MRSIVARAALALVLLVPACASGHASPAAPEQGAPAPDDPVVLDVANHTWADVDVYVLASSMRARLGTVASQGTTEVVVPRDVWAYGSIQVRVEPIGGEQPYVTDRIEIHGGQKITLTVEHQNGLSSWVVENTARW